MPSDATGALGEVYSESDRGEQILPCRRVERGEQHVSHSWRWYGSVIVADHWCLGLAAKDEQAVPDVRL